MWEVDTRKFELLCEFLPKFYILGLYLTAFTPEIVTQNFETLGAAVFIWHSNMLGRGVNTRKFELLGESLLDFYVFGLQLTLFALGIHIVFILY